MSRLPFELLLALRYLRPKRTSVSVITLISILGVMLGVAVLIIVISVMSGFDREWHEKILGFNAHMKVVKNGTTLRDFRQVMKVVAANPSVKGVAPFVIGKVLVETQPLHGEPQADAPVVRGIDPQAEASVSIIPNSVRQGSFDVSGNGLLVGSDFAQSMGLHVGDKLSVYSPRNLQKMKQSRAKGNDEAILPDEFSVRGIFDVGFADYNSLFLITSLANAQDLYALEDSVHGLMVMLRDPFQAPQVRDQLMASLGGDFRVITWMEEYSELFNTLLLEKNMIFFLLFFIVIVAAFGITSSLITFVVQKTREIGILKALGASNGQVLWLFLSQSLIVGVTGVFTGLGLGLLALKYRNEFLHFLSDVAGRQLLAAAIYKVYELPALTMTSDLVAICGGSLLICILAGIIPAWIAGRLKPVEALRHE